jgi:hypothetical protein
MTERCHWPCEARNPAQCTARRAQFRNETDLATDFLIHGDELCPPCDVTFDTCSHDVVVVDLDQDDIEVQRVWQRRLDHATPSHALTERGPLEFEQPRPPLPVSLDTGDGRPERGTIIVEPEAPIRANFHRHTISRSAQPQGPAQFLSLDGKHGSLTRLHRTSLHREQREPFGPSESIGRNVRMPILVRSFCVRLARPNIGCPRPALLGCWPTAPFWSSRRAS